MSATTDPAPAGRRRLRPWPWVVLGLLTLPALWHAVHFDADVDGEFPRVARPTFSPHPPAAYRLAEPGDTLDRIGIYMSSLGVVLSLVGLARGGERRRPWLAALAVSLAAFWYAANPWPTFDGWHGLAWRTALDPAVPLPQRLALAAMAAGLGALAIYGAGVNTHQWVGLWRAGRGRGVFGLLAVALGLAVARQVEWPGVGPSGYWPRWAFAWALVAFCAAMVRCQEAWRPRRRLVAVTVGVGGSVAVWYALVMAGIGLTWYHRPIARLREVVPGRIYICAMPTARGLEVAQARHHFKTIINLFPEDTPYRSPWLPDELAFARRHGVRYVGSPSDAASSNAFLDRTLALAQDPGAWPVLVHCHGCMDRTPAWVGIYRFVVEGKPLDEIFRFIEGHRGCRPKASVTLLYNRVLPRLAPERFMDDPTAALLHRCAEGTTDPYYAQVAAELAGANRDGASGVYRLSDTSAAGRLPNLTPRR